MCPNRKLIGPETKIWEEAEVPETALSHSQMPYLSYGKVRTVRGPKIVLIPDFSKDPHSAKDGFKLGASIRLCRYQVFQGRKSFSKVLPQNSCRWVRVTVREKDPDFKFSRTSRCGKVLSRILGDPAVRGTPNFYGGRTFLAEIQKFEQGR